MIDTSRYKPLSQITEWVDNYNHGDVAGIAFSIRRFGFNNALRLWRDNIVMAGNHTSKALKLIKSEGPKPDIDRSFPPDNVLVEGDEWYVQWVDVSHLDEIEAKAYAIADNQLVRKATADETLLAQYLQEILEHDEQTFAATGFTDDELEKLLVEIAADPATEEEKPKSDGSLLALTQVTIAEPRHVVERGDVWLLDQHVLICADVLREWPQWKAFLNTDDTIFAPYPGPFVPLTAKADSARFVMVQPDPYIAGHILDRYCDVKGEAHVQRRD
jgi:hypothetical protein